MKKATTRKPASVAAGSTEAEDGWKEPQPGGTVNILTDERTIRSIPLHHVFVVVEREGSVAHRHLFAVAPQKRKTLLASGSKVVLEQRYYVFHFPSGTAVPCFRNCEHSDPKKAEGEAKAVIKGIPALLPTIREAERGFPRINFQSEKERASYRKRMEEQDQSPPLRIRKRGGDK